MRGKLIMTMISIFSQHYPISAEQIAGGSIVGGGSYEREADNDDDLNILPTLSHLS